jgi:hypothetical protein
MDFKSGQYNAFRQYTTLRKRNSELIRRRNNNSSANSQLKGNPGAIITFTDEIFGQSFGLYFRKGVAKG